MSFPVLYGQTSMKKALVCGGGGFIGGHHIKRLKKEGWWMRAVDLKYPEYSESHADEFVIGDLRDPNVVATVLNEPFDRVYQYAADMGGAGYIFTGENDADVMHNSATINLNIAKRSIEVGVGILFYSSSACIYPERNQMDPNSPNCSEDSAYPAAPDSEYGWEKIFSERMYTAFHRNKGLDIRIARFHNVFGPESAWTGGREKAPTAICRKVAEAKHGYSMEMWEAGRELNLPYVEIWGDGKQTRSFLYVDECIEGVERLIASDVREPVNIGSDEMVTIKELVRMVVELSGVPRIAVNHVPGPQGVRGRNSDNRMIKDCLGWAPSRPLQEGIGKTFLWVEDQVTKKAKQ